MAKITRYTGNLLAFAAEALGTERTVFGDVTQSDTLDDNITANFRRGWGIVGVNENPTKQDFNALGFTATQLAAYLHQMGVTEWDIAQEYHGDSICQRNGSLYISAINTNVGNDPDIDDGTNWAQLGRVQVASIAKLRDMTPVDGREYYVKGTTVGGTNTGRTMRGVTGELAGTFKDTGNRVILPTGGDGSAAFVAVLERKNEITLLATGQSNMVGSSLVIAGDPSPDGRVLAWNATVGIVGTAWVTAALGSAPFSPTGSQHIAYNAAKYLADAFDVNVRIINLSLGGQSIDRWVSTDGTPTLWDAIIREVGPALLAAGVETIDYVMWHQGEADATVDIMEHRNKLRTVKGQFEGEAWWLNGHTKMIVGGLALGLPQTGTSGAADSQNLSLDLFAETDPEVLPVTTADLPSNTTGVHFDDPELIEIGNRYGKAATIQAPYIPRLISTRQVTGNINLTLAPADANFRDFHDLLEFIGTLHCTPNARIDVNISAGQYLLDIAPRLNLNGQFLRFYGDLAGGFVKPIDTDFSPIGTPDKAADYAMLQARYLTEIIIPGNAGMVVGGNFAGSFEDMLLTADTPTLGSAAIRVTDPTLTTPGGGSIRLENVAVHGWDGTSNLIIDNDNNGYVDFSGCIGSHCTAGASSNDARTTIKNALFAHCGPAANATNRAFINAFGLQLHGQTGVSYTANLGSFIDASSADDSANQSTATQGFVQV